MKRNSSKTGFTLVEVSLFLAISGAILFAIISGTGRSLARQRYNDSVQDLYSFLQSQYSKVIDPQNAVLANGIGGRSDKAIYGRLLIFQNSRVKAWDIVGNVMHGNDVDSYNTTTDAINGLELLVVGDIDNPVESYSPQWEGTIEKTIDNSPAEVSVVILRSPINGTVYTYKADEVIAISDCNSVGSTSAQGCRFINAASGKFTDSFNLADADNAVDLCLDTEDEAYGDYRRDIRISNTNTIDTIRLIPLDDGGDNQCR